MRNRLAFALVAVAVLGSTGRAQDVKDVIHQGGLTLGILRGLNETDFIVASQFDANGTMLVSGRMVKVPRYRGQMRWDIPGYRVDYDVEDGAQKQRHVEVVAGKFAWNEDKPGGGLTEKSGNATPRAEAYQERLIQLWLTPHGVMKAAAAAGSKATLKMVGGKPVVTFPLPAPLESTMFTLTLDATRVRPEKVETKIGAAAIEATYSGYKDFDNSDVYYPARVIQKRDGKVVLDLTVTHGMGYNPYVIFPVPKNVSAGQPGKVGG